MIAIPTVAVLAVASVMFAAVFHEFCQAAAVESVAALIAAACHDCV